MERQANTSIGCTVHQCAFHCQSQDFCSLGKINVGSLDPEPTHSECTECSSFRAAQ